MSILVVGSVALDSVETPFGSADRVIGGSAVFFAAAASLLGPVRLVGVIGDTIPWRNWIFLPSEVRISRVWYVLKVRAFSGPDGIRMI